MPLAAPPGPLWSADAKEPHPLGGPHRARASRLLSDDIGRERKAATLEGFFDWFGASS